MKALLVTTDEEAVAALDAVARYLEPATHGAHTVATRAAAFAELDLAKRFILASTPQHELAEAPQ